MTSLYDLVMASRTNLTYDDLPVGTKVRVAVPAEDFNFFYGETGTVIKNKHRYLAVIVQFDQPRQFEDGYVQRTFGFEPHSLALLVEDERDGRDWEEILHSACYGI